MEIDRRETIRQRYQFAAFVEKAIVNHPVQSLTEPFVIDSTLLQKSVAEERKNRPFKTSIFEIQQIYHPIGKLQAGDTNYHFFLMCKITSYQNCLIWAATEIDHRIAGIHMIAPYYRILERRITPTIWIEPPLICIHVDQSVKYPFKRHEQFDMRFRVASDGEIYRID